MVAKIPRFYVDANIFLYPILYKPELVPEVVLVEDFLKKIINQEILAYTSYLTWDEVTWVIRKELGIDTAIEKGEHFLRFPNLHFEGITFEIIQLAQEILKNDQLKPRDAIHLATATKLSITDIITFDSDFDHIERIQCHHLS
jgi:predicted nucleic acid-binding protein